MVPIMINNLKAFSIPNTIMLKLSRHECIPDYLFTELYINVLLGLTWNTNWETHAYKNIQSRQSTHTMSAITIALSNAHFTIKQLHRSAPSTIEVKTCMLILELLNQFNTLLNSTILYKLAEIIVSILQNNSRSTFSMTQTSDIGSFVSNIPS